MCHTRITKDGLDVENSNCLDQAARQVSTNRTKTFCIVGSVITGLRHFLEQETLSTLLSTGFYPGKKRATWKISTRLLNVLPSINKVDYYYFFIIIIIIIII